MGIILGILFFIAIGAVIFCIMAWGLWILGIMGDLFLGFYHRITGKPGKSSKNKTHIQITEKIDALDYATCRHAKKYTITIESE